MTIRRASRSILATVLLSACAGDVAQEATTLRVDTLSDGSIVVNNPDQGLWETDPDARWRITEDLRIGSATAEGRDAWYTNGRDLGGRYEIHRIDLESGDTLRTIVRWYQPVQVSDSMRAAALMSLWGRFSWSERPSESQWRKVPGVYPPVRSVYRSGDGTIWVRRSIGDGVDGFDVFDHEGRYLGQPEVPNPNGLFGMSVRWIFEDYVYAVDTDELGLDYVGRLAILR